MKRSPIAVLISVAALVACSDRQSPTQPSLNAPSPVVTEISMSGRVVPNPDRELKPAPLVLVVADGSMVPLSGDQTAWLASVVDTDVEARGVIDEYGQLDVESFTVQTVHGAPAYDGVLEFNDYSYALRLGIGGERREIADPPEELKLLVGKRIWITGIEDNSLMAFGAITEVSKLTDDSRARL